ncbi:MAG: DNA cytosine methyltransferase, partial [Candidatus Fonsibacter sp.]
MLEYVKGLVSRRPEALRKILARLRNIGGGIYDVGHPVLDTAKHGFPQHRERVFIVGIRRRTLKRKGVAGFRWPRPIPCLPLARLLDPLPVGSDVREAERNFLATCSPGLRTSLLDAFSRIKAAGLGRHSDDVVVVVDVDGTKAHWMRNLCHCRTRGRAASGFYLPARGRRITLAVLVKLQGIPS